MSLARLLALPLALAALPAAAQPSQWRLDLEAGASFTRLNEVRIPSRTGTEFDLNRMQGSPASPLIRVGVDLDPWQRHGFRLQYQYLRTEGTGTLPGATAFAGQAYAPGAATTGNYRFDTWRATYRYTLVDTPDFRLRVGATLLLRDAEIRLRQGGITSRDSDVGVVPLLHASFDWRFAPAWTLRGDVDALGASQGRAIDVGVRVAREFAPGWEGSLGWRMLDGGVDNSSVRNFARFHGVTLGAAYRF